MTTATARKVEHIELTNAIFQALLNMTASDADLQTAKVRSLVRVLHRVKAIGSNRWRIAVTEEDVRTMYYILSVYCLNRPQYKTRFTNFLSRQSDVYQRLVNEQEAGK